MIFKKRFYTESVHPSLSFPNPLLCFSQLGGDAHWRLSSLWNFPWTPSSKWSLLWHKPMYSTSNCLNHCVRHSVTRWVLPHMVGHHFYVSQPPLIQDGKLLQNRDPHFTHFSAYCHLIFIPSIYVVVSVRPRTVLPICCFCFVPELS